MRVFKRAYQGVLGAVAAALLMVGLSMLAASDIGGLNNVLGAAVVTTLAYLAGDAC